MGSKGKGGSCLTGSNSNGLDFHIYLKYGFMIYDISYHMIYLNGFMMIYDYDNYNI